MSRRPREGAPAPRVARSSIIETGGVTFASIIALKYGEAGPTGTGALIAAGLCLFLLTLAVNFTANMIVRRHKVA